MMAKVSRVACCTYAVGCLFFLASLTNAELKEVINPGYEKAYNMTRVQLLRSAEAHVRRGYVPPALAPLLYDGNLDFPVHALTKGWGPHIPAHLHSEHQGPPGKTSVISGIKFFGTTESMEEFIFEMRNYGLSTALQIEGFKRDPVLLYGLNPLGERSEHRTQAEGPVTKDITRAVRWMISKRASAQPAHEQPELSDEAVESLKHIRKLIMTADRVKAQDAVRNFFKFYGTHVLHGPVLWGGQLFATSEEFGWKANSENEMFRAKAAVDCQMTKKMREFGVPLNCDQNHDPSSYWVGTDSLDIQVRGVLGGDPSQFSHDKRKWMRSIAWGPEPSSSWEVVDRGHPIPVYELIHKGRDSELGAALKDFVKKEYVKLWHESNPRLLHHTAALGDRTTLKHLLHTFYEDPNIKDSEGRTALHEAAAGGQDENIAQLVQSGAKVNVQDRAHRTPLHEAAKHDLASTCLLLLKHGADISLADGQRQDALKEAQAVGAEKAEKVLRFHHEKIHGQDKHQ